MMIQRMPTHCGDDTCPSCVLAGDYVFVSHQAGGFDQCDAAHQLRACFENLRRTLESAGATLDDMVQINLYLRNIGDFRKARDVFYEYFCNGFPARMSSTTDFVDSACLCMIDGVAYRKRD